MLSDPYYTGPYVQWEIRDVRWMYQDGVGDKRRKAILISDTDFNETSAFLRFLKFSTKDRPSRYKIHITRKHPEWSYLGLPEECFLYVDKTQRIPKAKVDKRKGQVGAILGAQIVAMLKQIEKDDLAAGAQPIPSPQPPTK